MKRHRTSMLLSAVFVILGGLGSIDAAAGQSDNRAKGSRCSLMALRGTYAASLSGWVTSGEGRVPYAEVAYLNLDGKGGLTGMSTFSLDGVVGTRNLTGTYTIDPTTCTGDAVTVIGNFFFVVADNVNQTRFIATSPGVTATGDAVRQ